MEEYRYYMLKNEHGETFIKTCKDHYLQVIKNDSGSITISYHNWNYSRAGNNLLVEISSSRFTIEHLRALKIIDKVALSK